MQSYPTTVLNDRMRHFRGGGGAKHTLPLLHIFRGSRLPSSGSTPLAPGIQDRLAGRAAHLTVVADDEARSVGGQARLGDDDSREGPDVDGVALRRVDDALSRRPAADHLLAAASRLARP